MSSHHKYSSPISHLQFFFFKFDVSLQQIHAMLTIYLITTRVTVSPLCLAAEPFYPSPSIYYFLKVSLMTTKHFPSFKLPSFGAMAGSYGLFIPFIMTKPVPDPCHILKSTIIWVKIFLCISFSLLYNLKKKGKPKANSLKTPDRHCYFISPSYCETHWIVSMLAFVIM